MAFHFPLQALLRLRQSLERREELRLAFVIGRINQLRRQCEELDQLKLQSATALSERAKAGLVAAEYQFEIESISALDRCKKNVLLQITQAEQEKLTQEQAFREAQQKRKTLEQVRDRLLGDYRMIQARREQQRLDDQFNLLRSDSKRQ